MKGYKVFVCGGEAWYGERKWTGPHYHCPPSWRIAAGAILESVVDPNRDVECGEGVNFYRNKKDAISCVCGSVRTYACIYEVETLPDSVIIIPTDSDNSKVRTNRLRLVKRISLTKNGRKVTKVRK